MAPAAAVVAYLRRQVREIEADPALRWYGACLAAAHLVCFLWWRGDPLEAFVARDVEPICWPMLEDCHVLRVLPAAGVRALLWLLIALAVATAALFARRAWSARAYAALFALTLLKTGVLLLDYRLRMNQHYMHGLVLGAYLLAPNKRDLLRCLLVGFYVAAGALKWNQEWLSGAALYRPPWPIPAALVPASCWYVNILECFLAWGLLARGRAVFWATLAQVCAFHLVSWSVVDFFYPLLMFALIAVFPLARRLGPAAADGRARDPAGTGPPGSLLASLVRGRQPRSSYVLLGLYTAMQLVPVAIPGDEAITGEGRLLALHMFDALVICREDARVRDRQGGSYPVRLRLERRPSRTSCDPIVYWNRARNLCRARAGDPGFGDLDLALHSRRRTDAAYRTVIDIRGFCARDPGYHLWRPNGWIRRAGPLLDLDRADRPRCTAGCDLLAREGRCATRGCLDACLADPDGLSGCVLACPEGDCGCMERCW